jgi:hypothetical protein
MGNRGDHGRASAPDIRRNDASRDDAVSDPFAFESVILPARVESSVARQVAIASNRDGVSIADLLGRAAAAYDWQVEDDLTT